MSRDPYPLKLPAWVKREAARLAREDGVSLDHWITAALAQKIGAMESAKEFFVRRARGATGDGLLAILDRVPDNPPVPGDELEDDGRPTARARTKKGQGRRRPGP